MRIASKAHGGKQVTLTCLFDNRSFGNGVQDWVAKYGYSSLYDSGIGPYQNHGGIDIVGGLGSSITAVNGGTVVQAGWNGAAGQEVRIWTGSQTHRYLHLDSISVSNGQTVTAGQQIGTEGGSGGYPVHLHFEVWGSQSSGNKLDPFNIVQNGGSGGAGGSGQVEELAFVSDLSKWDKGSTKLGIYIGGLVKVSQGTILYADQEAKQRIRTTRIDGQVFEAEADRDEQVKPIHIYKDTYVAVVVDQLGKQQTAWIKF